MGTMIKAKCKHCGFEKKFSFGAGMMDFKTNCAVPAINRETSGFVVLNFFDVGQDQDNYVFYNDPIMNLHSTGKKSIQWGDVYLGKAENLCPSCKTYNLDFEETGRFD
jgi:hypothetical protein